MVFLTENKIVLVLYWFEELWYSNGAATKRRIPDEKVQIRTSVRTYPLVYITVFVHLLMKECISNVVYWYGVQVFIQVLSFKVGGEY